MKIIRWKAALLVAAVLSGAVLLKLALLYRLPVSHYLRGRAGTCTLAESLQSVRLSRAQRANVDGIRSASRVVGRDDVYSLWSTPLGEFWMTTASGDALIYDLGEQARDIYGTGVHRGDIVLDAGANVGVFTRRALAAGAGKVIAIEPGPENLECLRRNFAREIEAGRVVLYGKGIWDKDDVLRFAIDPGSSAKDSFLRPADGSRVIQVAVTTVDHMVAELGLARVDFVKMDIEGAEQRAIRGARGTISRFRPRMAICIYHVQGDDTMVPKLVAETYAGYRVARTCLCVEDKVQPEVAFFE